MSDEPKFSFFRLSIKPISFRIGFRDHFGIRPRGQQRIGACFGCHSTPLRLARRAFAPFRGSQTPSRKNNTKRISVHLYLFLSRPAH
jgi:hypothetical protein